MSRLVVAGILLVSVVLLLQGNHFSGEPLAAEADFTEARARMVREQLVAPGRGITNPRVLAVMAKVPRHEFVSVGLRAQAYGDHALPIGYEQTISQPFIVAFMTEKLDPKPTDRVLEIGTGSGYQAAVLAELESQAAGLHECHGQGRRRLQRLARGRAVRRRHRHLRARSCAATARGSAQGRRTNDHSGRRRRRSGAVHPAKDGGHGRHTRRPARAVCADDGQERR